MIGSDFECFMFTPRGEFVPELHLGLPAKGEQPERLLLDGKHVGFIHRDNVSVEMCTLASAPAQFAESVRVTVEAAKHWVGKKAGALLAPITTVELPDEILTHPHACELGCDIDQIPSSKRMDSVDRLALEAGMLQNKRYSGGHVHISYPFQEVPQWVAALLCDLFLGFPMIPDLDKERAQWYGEAGLHRKTMYPNGDGGVEYRPLDSRWVHSDVGRLKVQTGATFVNNILNALDHDVIAQLMRLRATVPEQVKLVDVDVRQARIIATQAMEIAKKYGG